MKSFHLFTSLPTELRLKIYRDIEEQSICAPTFSSNAQRNEHDLHILKISYSPSKQRYVSNTAPPITLSICKESREQTLMKWNNLSLGPSPTRDQPKPKVEHSLIHVTRIPHHHYRSSFALRPAIVRSSSSISEKTTSKTTTDMTLPIPINYSTTILYISDLSLLLSTMHFQHTFLFHLSTSLSRHLIQYLAIDLRVWNELCEHGFLGVLGRMKGLRELRLVVEFGRSFTGPLGFLPSPKWRTDLQYLARNASRDIERIRGGLRDLKSLSDGTEQRLAVVDVQCVILTRGGEHA